VLSRLRQENYELEANLGYIARYSLKTRKLYRAGSVAQAIERLHSKCEALSSNPSSPPSPPKKKTLQIFNIPLGLP
jgi:hypothetical protein